MIKRLSLNYKFDTRELVVVLNEVIDELNRQQKHITNVGEAVSLLEDGKFKESAKKEEQSPEEQSPLIQELTRNQAYAIEEAKLQAVEAYKNRLVEAFSDSVWFRGINLDEAIKLVEDTD